MDKAMVVVCATALGYLLVVQPFGIPASIGVPISGAIATVGVLGAFAFWEKRRRPLRTEEHSIFGPVTIFRDRWEANATLLGRSVQLMGGSGGAPPSDKEVLLFKQLEPQLTALVSASVDALQLDMNSIKPPIRPEHLLLKSISLEPDNASADLSLYFDVPSHIKQCPWGLYVDFSQFAVVEAGSVH